MSKKIGERILKVIASILPRVEATAHKDKHSTPVDPPHDLESFFAAQTPKERADWNKKALKRACGFSMNTGHRSQKEGKLPVDR